MSVAEEIENVSDTTGSKYSPPISSLAPYARRLLHTALELKKAAQYKGVNTLPLLNIAALFRSASLLSSRSAESQALKQQVSHSGVAWGGREGAPASPL